MRRRRAVVVDQPGLHTAQWQTDPAGATLACGEGAHRDQCFGGAVSLHRLVAGELGEPVEHGHGQRCAAGHQQPGRRQRQRRVEVADHSRPHRRHAEVQRTLGGGITGGRRFPGVHEPVSDPQRAKQPEHKSVDVEQRKPVHQGVVGRPLPRLRQRIDVGGDGAPAHDDALRRSGGAGGVHDQRGGLRRTAPGSDATNGHAAAPERAAGPRRRRVAPPATPAHPSR